MPDFDRWSDRVVVALGQNPSSFTGPGTNTYLVGTGEARILLDSGHGVEAYLPVLERAMEATGEYAFEMHPLADGDYIETEGARLTAHFTPGHAPDHVCFRLEEEGAFFTGDNVLGLGTTVIPAGTGNLGQYMISLEHLLVSDPGRLYPAHGPVIANGRAKLREYIDHRLERERQILATLGDGVAQIAKMVTIIYRAYPEHLYAAAGQSVGSHLLKLEAEGRVVRSGEAGAAPTSVGWALA